jgi:hypothetical protein
MSWNGWRLHPLRHRRRDGRDFYVEPLLTFDLDVFVVRSIVCSGAVSAPTSDPPAVIDRRYSEALRGRGYSKEEGECVLKGVPVQFLPAYNALLEEALKEAQEIMYEDMPARVLRNEHLVAICLQTGRSKDRERVRILREQAKLDQNFVVDLLSPTNLRTNGSCGRSKRRDRQNICGEGTTPAGASPPAISGESARGDRTAKYGRNHSRRDER